LVKWIDIDPFLSLIDHEGEGGCRGLGGGGGKKKEKKTLTLILFRSVMSYITDHDPVECTDPEKHGFLENPAFPKFGGCNIYGFAPKRSLFNSVFLLTPSLRIHEVGVGYAFSLG